MAEGLYISLARQKWKPLKVFQASDIQRGIISILEQWKKTPGCLGYIRDEKLPSYIGIVS